MKVYKLGGASIRDKDRIKQMAAITRNTSGGKTLIVISAMGKTTNALEKVAEAFYDKRREEAIAIFNTIKEQHLTIARELLDNGYPQTVEHLSGFFTEIEWLLHDNPVQEYDYYYDQVVCIGEMLSSAIISAYFNQEGIMNKWVDVRDVLRTNDTFREAVIDWDISLQRTADILRPLFNETEIIITQGFIGSTDENESTTLGREGSDYTAAVFANMLGAESITLWKDVAGVMSADPREFPEAVLLKELTYQEMTEIAYNGAKIIHPKTIKPLQDKNIPMYVKCFLDHNLPGTIIKNKY